MLSLTEGSSFSGSIKYLTESDSSFMLFKVTSTFHLFMSFQQLMMSLTTCNVSFYSTVCLFPMVKRVFNYKLILNSFLNRKKSFLLSSAFQSQIYKTWNLRCSASLLDIIPYFRNPSFLESSWYKICAIFSTTIAL